MHGHDQNEAGHDEDAALMMRVRGGDRDAFARLYDRNARMVVNFAYRFVQDRALAEEVAQEVFLKLHKSAARYQPTARFKTYLLRIAANHCLNERRRLSHRADAPATAAQEERMDPMPSPASDSPDEALAGAQLERALSNALALLPERERAAFVMARFEGMAYRDIAEALGASEPAVKSLIHRATVSVAQQLAPVVGSNPVEASRAARREP